MVCPARSRGPSTPRWPRPRWRRRARSRCHAPRRADRVGIDPRARQRPLHRADLAFLAGRPQALAAAVAGAADAAPDAVDPAPAGPRVLEALQEHHAHAVGGHEAVGAGIEGEGAVGGQRAGLREQDDGRLLRERHPAGEGEVGPPLTQGPRGDVQRGEGRGAGGVHDHVPARHPQRRGDHPGHGAGDRARAAVPAPARVARAQAGHDALVNRGAIRGGQPRGGGRVVQRAQQIPARHREGPSASDHASANGRGRRPCSSPAPPRREGRHARARRATSRP